MDAFNWRTERQRERDAWVVMHLLLPYSSKDDPLTVDKLLGREPEMSEEEKYEALHEYLTNENVKFRKTEDANQ